MSTSTETRDDETQVDSPVGLSSVDIDPQRIVTYETSDGDTEYYIPYSGETQSHRYHFLRGTCDAEVETDDGSHICGYDAAFRRVNKNGIEEYCRVHAPDQWEVVMEEETNLDNCIINLRAPCEACISSSVSTEGDDDPLVKPNRCGDRAAILVASPDGDDIHSKACCMAHAMPSWKRQLHLPTGMPGRPRIEGEAGRQDTDTKYWMDAPTGRVFETHTEWEKWAQGHYKSVVEAHERLVCLDDSGITVL